jgi:hypothetical protein
MQSFLMIHLEQQDQFLPIDKIFYLIKKANELITCSITKSPWSSSLSSMTKLNGFAHSCSDRTSTATISS